VGRPKKSSPKNLRDQLDKHKLAVLAFPTDFGIHFENNVVKRDVRMVKLKQKAPRDLRTQSGPPTLCAIRNYIATLRKYGGNVIQVLHYALAHQPFIPAVR
jgi:hypothetical protein